MRSCILIPKTDFWFCLMLRLKTGGRENWKRQRGGLKGKIEFVVLWSNENKWSSLCCEQRDLFVCETWLIHMRDIAHLYDWFDSSVWVTWLMTCELACYLCVTWPSRIHMWWLIDVWHESLVWVTWLIRMSDMTHNMWASVLFVRDVTRLLHARCSEIPYLRLQRH